MISFKGLDELQAKFRRNATMDDVKSVVKKNSAQMTLNSQRLARVDTSHMKNMTLQFTENGGMSGGTRNYTSYGIYNDVGTRFMSGNGFMKKSHILQSSIFKQEIEMLMK